MDKPYYLIDFENVQPRALDRLKPGAARIKVFLGAQQTKLMLDLVCALQPFGADAEYVPISGNGPNAVDFHIAYHIGCLSAKEPGAAFRIISKDKGFDPLVQHLVGRGIDCKRLDELSPASKVPGGKAAVSKPVAAAPKKAPVKKKPAKGIAFVVDPPRSAAKASVPAATSTTHAKAVLALLAKSTKPGKVSGLRASIKSWLKAGLDEKAIDAVLQNLTDTRHIVIDGARVTYAMRAEDNGAGFTS